MGFYDAFSFIQVTVMMLILVALSSALVLSGEERQPQPARVRRALLMAGD
jgi:hypothetical protein